MAQTISPSQLKTVLTQTVIPSGISAFITGAPGIGKSDLIRSVANDLDLEVVDVRASLLDPVDLRGLPSIDGGETTWNQPDFLPTEGKGIIFLDEINVAPKLVQGALVSASARPQAGRLRGARGLGGHRCGQPQRGPRHRSRCGHGIGVQDSYISIWFRTSMTGQSGRCKTTAVSRPRS